MVGERDSSAKGLTALIALEAGSLGFDSCIQEDGCVLLNVV